MDYPQRWSRSMSTLITAPVLTGIATDDSIVIPRYASSSLTGFRRWALSDDFPERGRIDFLPDGIEIDMSPEDLYCHGSLKMHLGRVLTQIVEDENLGDIFGDRSRV